MLNVLVGKGGHAYIFVLPLENAKENDLQEYILLEEIFSKHVIAVCNQEHRI